MSRSPVALTVAGSDPSGGAGIQADLKVFHQFGVYGEAAIAAITVQNSLGVSHVEPLAPSLVARQIRSVLEDIPPAAVKTGALGSAANVLAISGLAREFGFPLVVDPVMTGSHGGTLLSDDALPALLDHLLPLATLVTPNLYEAFALTGIDITGPSAMRAAAERIVSAGAKAVLVKGGHLEGAPTDVLLYDGQWFEFGSERIATSHTHGTGCVYSAAITAGLALGRSLPDAVKTARAWVTEAIRTNPGLGSGSGPLNLFAETL